MVGDICVPPLLFAPASLPCCRQPRRRVLSPCRPTTPWSFAALLQTPNQIFQSLFTAAITLSNVFDGGASEALNWYDGRSGWLQLGAAGGGAPRCQGSTGLPLCSNHGASEQTAQWKTNAALPRMQHSRRSFPAGSSPSGPPSLPCLSAGWVRWAASASAFSAASSLRDPRIQSGRATSLIRLAWVWCCLQAPRLLVQWAVFVRAAGGRAASSSAGGARRPDVLPASSMRY